MDIRNIAYRMGVAMLIRIGDEIQKPTDIDDFGWFTRCLRLARCLRVVMMMCVVGPRVPVIMVMHMQTRRLKG